MDQVNMFLLLVIVNLVTEPQSKTLAKMCGVAALLSFFWPLLEIWGKQ